MEIGSTSSKRKNHDYIVVKKGKRKPRIFDFTRYNQRYLAFKLAYLGWDYHGLASQEGIEKTIEAELFNAFSKTRLIESRASSNYSRSGRTDKGVSALGQVIALKVRTNLSSGPGVIIREGLHDPPQHAPSGKEVTELSYVKMLNSVLPDDIRILAWSPVDNNFSARFSTIHRTYKYFFPRANLNIELMNEAAQKLKGEHDYRNFCKIDLAHVSNFRREILSIQVQAIEETTRQGFEICEIIICGTAFLWHQVRCIAAILFLIGQGLENPDIIDYMLDIKKCEKKPQYGMASEFPLVLFDCAYKDIDWIYDPYAHNRTVKHFKKLWAEYAIKTTLIKEMLRQITISADEQTKKSTNATLKYDQPGLLTPGHHDQVFSYKPIRTRPKCGRAPAT